MADDKLKFLKAPFLTPSPKIKYDTKTVLKNKPKGQKERKKSKHH